jgi:hypothetical protein
MTHKIFHKGEAVEYRGKRYIILTRNPMRHHGFVSIVPEDKAKLVEIKDLRKSKFAQW